MYELKLLKIENNNSRETIKKYLIEKFGEDYLKYENNKIPSLTNNWNISISNKNNLILIGLTQKSNKIGVDLENLNQEISIESFAKGILNENEKKLFEKITLNKKQRLILIWSIKEAFFKCINEDFDPKEVIITNIQENKFEIKLEQYEASGEYLIIGNYISTYCKLN